MFPCTGEFGSFNFLYSRRSIRKFVENYAINDVIIKEILRAAMSAPSACAKDPWRFIIVRDKQTMKVLASTFSTKVMQNAIITSSFCIVVCGEEQKAFMENFNFMLLDCSAAIQNILLAVNSIGLASCWLSVFFNEERVFKFKRTLLIPESVTPIACLPVGKASEKKEARTRYNDKFVHYHQW